jgi:hypothetical protein
MALLNAPRHVLRLAALWLALACALLSPTRAHAESNASVERQVKAAYLYKFASFVEWPDGVFGRSDSPLLIGVAGNDALAEQLEQIVAGRSANGRPIVVRKLHRGDAPGAVHILFIGSADKAATQELLAAARGQAVLTVSDSDETFALGSMINFVVADDKLRFQVALKPVASSRLRISARMLAAAQKVQQEGAS